MRVRYGAQAIEQLEAIRDWFTDRAGPDTADRIIDALFERCDSLCSFPLRGTLRADVRPGLRTIPHRRRFTIGYRVQDDVVIILGVLGAGQDWNALIDLS